MALDETHEPGVNGRRYAGSSTQPAWPEPLFGGATPGRYMTSDAVLEEESGVWCFTYREQPLGRRED